MIKKNKITDYIDRVPPKKFETVLNKSTGKKEVIPNILKHLFGSTSLYHYLKIF